MRDSVPEDALIETLTEATRKLRQFVNVWKRYLSKVGHDDLIEKAIDEKYSALRKATYALMQYLWQDFTAADVFRKLLLE